MSFVSTIGPVEWFFLLYFVVVNGFYLLLNYLAVFRVFRHLEETSLERFHVSYTGLEPPISLLVPAYNEEETIVTSVYSLLQLEYPEHEVVVINDGSTDRTLDALIEEFDLEPAPEVYRRQLHSETVHQIYHSRDHPALRVIDKDNGGKADALNAGINNSRYPLFCSIDADSFLERQSLKRVVLPFIEDSTTVAVGGTVRIANGCQVRDGHVIRVGLPSRMLPLFQIVEYLRAFLFGRLGWAQIGSLLVISGAFGLFRRDAVVDAGGYDRETVGEDMELTVRLHHQLRESGRPYKITFVPEPICWTEVPRDLKTLAAQRMRWQRGLTETLFRHRGMFFNRRAGVVGWLGLPFMLFGECLAPIVEVAGYLYMVVGWYLGYVSPTVMLLFLVVAIGLGTLLSLMGLLLEELSFKVYSRSKEVLVLFAAAMLENFGYRQLIAVFRLVASLQWLFGVRGRWGDMRRSAPWRSANAEPAAVED